MDAVIHWHRCGQLRTSLALERSLEEDEWRGKRSPIARTQRFPTAAIGPASFLQSEKSISKDVKSPEKRRETNTNRTKWTEINASEWMRVVHVHGIEQENGNVCVLCVNRIKIV